MNIEQPDENECTVDLGDIKVKVADKPDSPAGLLVDVDGADAYPVTVDLSQFRDQK
ncbi:hypothetical protein M0R89_11620 [Halorussus limi]|uniref:Uncharacterized protein n=1 Tax=Halorussus limi TaxID=2938695 RepID=A0A8U0HR32_9EURY|nr:hypothetical protein [Halorussus limi]UPV73196.1 hypothetical protein M0R89_11620 [Halorussus limi]